MKKHQRSMLSLQLHGKQLLALLLSAILLFASLPVAAIAEDGLPQEDGTPQIYDVTVPADGENEDAADGMVTEVESLREANVKHFYMGDGTYRAVSYGSAVHRKDAEGVWQEIDNTLTLQNGYHTTPDGRIKLASSSTANGYLLQLAENGYGIDMAMLPLSDPSGDMSMDMNANATLNTGSVTVNNVQREAVLETDSAEVKYQKLSKTLNHAKLTYANLSAGLDVSYELSGNKITEKIVVKGVRESYEFAFRLSLTGLTAALDEENAITFADAETGEAVYTMPAPFMTDLASGTTHAAAYELLAVDEESYLLIVSVDAELANEILTANTVASGNAASTLAVNVSISDTEEITEGIYSTYISEDYPTTCYGDMSMFQVGDGCIGYMYFPMPDIPDFAHVSNGTVYLFCEVEDTYTLGIYECLAPWLNTNWTWALAAQQDNMGLAATPVAEETVSTKERFPFNITSLVQKWHSQQFNNGFAIRSLYGGDPFTIYGEDAGAPEENAMLSVSYYYTQPNIINDTFYIRNVVNKKFLEAIVTENSTSVTPTLESWQASMAQRWNIVNLHNGYFRIEDEAKGHLLTACGNTVSSGVAVQPANSNIAAYQQWRLISKDGGYAIASRASYNATTALTNTLCIATESTESQPTVGLASNLDATTTNEVWNLLDVDSTNFVRVQVYYDHAYVSRYGGDSSNESTRIETVRTRLYNHMTGLQERYENDFSIYIGFEIMENPINCYACASNRICYQNHNSGCSCANDSQCQNDNLYHHTNIQNIQNNLNVRYSWKKQGDDRIVKIFFIGHEYCYVDGKNTETTNDDEHILVMDIYGICLPDDGYMMIQRHRTHLDPDNLDQFVDAQPEDEYQTLLHEFGHMFRAQDHYYDDDFSFDKLSTNEINQQNNTTAYSENCIYGENKDDDSVKIQGTICIGCRQDILAHASDFTHN